MGGGNEDEEVKRFHHNLETIKKRGGDAESIRAFLMSFIAENKDHHTNDAVSWIQQSTGQLSANIKSMWDTEAQRQNPDHPQTIAQLDQESRLRVQTGELIWSFLNLVRGFGAKSNVSQSGSSLKTRQRLCETWSAGLDAASRQPSSFWPARSGTLNGLFTCTSTTTNKAQDSRRRISPTPMHLRRDRALRTGHKLLGMASRAQAAHTGSPSSARQKKKRHCWQIGAGWSACVDCKRKKTKKSLGDCRMRRYNIIPAPT
jgi:hypothetical protein